MMIYSFALVVLVFSIISNNCNAKTLIVNDGPEWCPHVCVPTPENPKGGYMAEFINLAIKEMGYQAKHVTAPWSRAIVDVREGRSTLMMGLLKDDAPDFIFSEESFGITRNCFFTHKNSHWKYDGVASLKKLKLGVTQGFTYDGDALDEYIAEMGEKNTTQVIAVKSEKPIDQMIQMLKAERLDVFVEDEFVGNYNLEQHDLNSQFEAHGCLPEELLYIGFSPALKESKALARQFDDAILKLRKSGEIQEILYKYNINDWQGKKR